MSSNDSSAGATRPCTLAQSQVPEPASAATSVTTDMTETYRPITLSEPLRVASGLCMYSAVAISEERAVAITRLAERWIAWLDLNQQVLARLMQLWNVVLAVGADEISDWALPASCKVTSRDSGEVPRLLGVTCTVYASGEVSFAISVDGIDPALWFDESLDLNDYAVSSAPGHNLHAGRAA